MQKNIRRIVWLSLSILTMGLFVYWFVRQPQPKQIPNIIEAFSQKRVIEEKLGVPLPEYVPTPVMEFDGNLENLSSPQLNEQIRAEVAKCVKSILGEKVSQLKDLTEITVALEQKYLKTNEYPRWINYHAKDEKGIRRVLSIRSLDIDSVQGPSDEQNWSFEVIEVGGGNIPKNIVPAQAFLKSEANKKMEEHLAGYRLQGIETQVVYEFSGGHLQIHRFNKTTLGLQAYLPDGAILDCDEESCTCTPPKTSD